MISSLICFIYLENLNANTRKREHLESLGSDASSCAMLASPCVILHKRVNQFNLHIDIFVSVLVWFYLSLDRKIATNWFGACIKFVYCLVWFS